MLRDEPQRLVVVYGEEREIGSRSRVRRQVLNGRFHGNDPPLLVLPKPDGVIQVHLDQILVEAVVAAYPAAVAVDKQARGNIHVRTDQTREWLAKCWLRVEEILLALLCQSTVGFVPCQITETCPFHHQRADGSNTVGG